MYICFLFFNQLSDFSCRKANQRKQIYIKKLTQRIPNVALLPLYAQFTLHKRINQNIRINKINEVSNSYLCIKPDILKRQDTIPRFPRLQILETVTERRGHLARASELICLLHDSLRQEGGVYSGAEQQCLLQAVTLVEVINATCCILHQYRITKGLLLRSTEASTERHNVL